MASVAMIRNSNSNTSLNRIESIANPNGRLRSGYAPPNCNLCGGNGAAVRCEKCNSMAFCVGCDDMYHRHPKRRNHLRQAVALEFLQNGPNSLSPQQQQQQHGSYMSSASSPSSTITNGTGHSSLSQSNQSHTDPTSESATVIKPDTSNLYPWRRTIRTMPRMPDNYSWEPSGQSPRSPEPKLWIPPPPPSKMPIPPPRRKKKLSFSGLKDTFRRFVGSDKHKHHHTPAPAVQPEPIYAKLRPIQPIDMSASGGVRGGHVLSPLSHSVSNLERAQSAQSYQSRQSPYLQNQRKLSTSTATFRPLPALPSNNYNHDDDDHDFLGEFDPVYENMRKLSLPAIHPSHHSAFKQKTRLFASSNDLSRDTELNERSDSRQNDGEESRRGSTLPRKNYSYHDILSMGHQQQPSNMPEHQTQVMHPYQAYGQGWPPGYSPDSHHVLHGSSQSVFAGLCSPQPPLSAAMIYPPGSPMFFNYPPGTHPHPHTCAYSNHRPVGNSSKQPSPSTCPSCRHPSRSAAASMTNSLEELTRSHSRGGGTGPGSRRFVDDDYDDLTDDADDGDDDDDIDDIRSHYHNSHPMGRHAKNRTRRHQASSSNSSMRRTQSSFSMYPNMEDGQRRTATPSGGDNQQTRRQSSPNHSDFQQSHQINENGTMMEQESNNKSSHHNHHKTPSVSSSSSTSYDTHHRTSITASAMANNRTPMVTYESEPRKLDQEEEVNHLGQWSCRFCTFFNDSYKNICEICCKTRLKPSTTARAPITKPDANQPLTLVDQSSIQLPTLSQPRSTEEQIVFDEKMVQEQIEIEKELERRRENERRIEEENRRLVLLNPTEDQPVDQSTKLVVESPIQPTYKNVDKEIPIESNPESCKETEDPQAIVARLIEEKISEKFNQLKLVQQQQQDSMKNDQPEKDTDQNKPQINNVEQQKIQANVNEKQVDLVQGSTQASTQALTQTSAQASSPPFSTNSTTQQVNGDLLPPTTANSCPIQPNSDKLNSVVQPLLPQNQSNMDTVQYNQQNLVQQLSPNQPNFDAVQYNQQNLVQPPPPQLNQQQFSYQQPTSTPAAYPPSINNASNQPINQFNQNNQNQPPPAFFQQQPTPSLQSSTMYGSNQFLNGTNGIGQFNSGGFNSQQTPSQQLNNNQQQQSRQFNNWTPNPNSGPDQGPPKPMLGAYVSRHSSFDDSQSMSSVTSSSLFYPNQMESGLQIIQTLRDAEKKGYNADDVEIAIQFNPGSPLEWLDENWHNMGETVLTMANNQIIDLEQQNRTDSSKFGVGLRLVSEKDARIALRACKGNIWQAVEKCIQRYHDNKLFGDHGGGSELNKQTNGNSTQTQQQKVPKNTVNYSKSLSAMKSAMFGPSSRQQPSSTTKSLVPKTKSKSFSLNVVGLGSGRANNDIPPPTVEMVSDDSDELTEEVVENVMNPDYEQLMLLRHYQEHGKTPMESFLDYSNDVYGDEEEEEEESEDNHVNNEDILQQQNELIETYVQQLNNSATPGGGMAQQFDRNQMEELIYNWRYEKEMLEQERTRYQLVEREKQKMQKMIDLQRRIGGYLSDGTTTEEELDREVERVFSQQQQQQTQNQVKSRLKQIETLLDSADDDELMMITPVQPPSGIQRNQTQSEQTVVDEFNVDEELNEDVINDFRVNYRDQYPAEEMKMEDEELEEEDMFDEIEQRIQSTLNSLLKSKSPVDSGSAPLIDYDEQEKQQEPIPKLVDNRRLKQKLTNVVESKPVDQQPDEEQQTISESVQSTPTKTKTKTTRIVKIKVPKSGSGKTTVVKTVKKIVPKKQPNIEQEIGETPTIVVENNLIESMTNGTESIVDQQQQVTAGTIQSDRKIQSIELSESGLVKPTQLQASQSIQQQPIQSIQLASAQPAQTEVFQQSIDSQTFDPESIQSPPIIEQPPIKSQLFQPTKIIQQQTIQPLVVPSVQSELNQTILSQDVQSPPIVEQPPIQSKLFQPTQQQAAQAQVVSSIESESVQSVHSLTGQSPFTNQPLQLNQQITQQSSTNEDLHLISNQHQQINLTELVQFQPNVDSQSIQQSPLAGFKPNLVESQAIQQNQSTVNQPIKQQQVVISSELNQQQFIQAQQQLQGINQQGKQSIQPQQTLSTKSNQNLVQQQQPIQSQNFVQPDLQSTTISLQSQLNQQNQPAISTELKQNLIGRSQTVEQTNQQQTTIEPIHSTGQLVIDYQPKIESLQSGVSTDLKHQQQSSQQIQSIQPQSILSDEANQINLVVGLQNVQPIQQQTGQSLPQLQNSLINSVQQTTIANSQSPSIQLLETVSNNLKQQNFVETVQPNQQQPQSCQQSQLVINNLADGQQQAHQIQRNQQQMIQPNESSTTVNSESYQNQQQSTLSTDLKQQSEIPVTAVNYESRPFQQQPTFSTELLQQGQTVATAVNSEKLPIQQQSTLSTDLKQSVPTSATANSQSRPFQQQPTLSTELLQQGQTVATAVNSEKLPIQQQSTLSTDLKQSVPTSATANSQSRPFQQQPTLSTELIQQGQTVATAVNSENITFQQQSSLSTQLKQQGQTVATAVNSENLPIQQQSTLSTDLKQMVLTSAAANSENLSIQQQPTLSTELINQGQTSATAVNSENLLIQQQSTFSTDLKQSFPTTATANSENLSIQQQSAVSTEFIQQGLTPSTTVIFESSQQIPIVSTELKQPSQIPALVANSESHPIQQQSTVSTELNQQSAKLNTLTIQENQFNKNLVDELSAQSIQQSQQSSSTTANFETPFVSTEQQQLIQSGQSQIQSQIQPFQPPSTIIVNSDSQSKQQSTTTILTESIQNQANDLAVKLVETTGDLNQQPETNPVIVVEPTQPPSSTGSKSSTRKTKSKPKTENIIAPAGPIEQPSLTLKSELATGPNTVPEKSQLGYSRLEYAVDFQWARSEFECELCTEMTPVNDIVAMISCTHFACRPCLKRYYTVQIRERQRLVISCPFCDEPNLDADDDEKVFEYLALFDQFIRYIVDQDVYELFQRKQCDRALMRDPNFQWCTQCSSGFIMPNAHALTVMCPDCRCLTCRKCKRLWRKQHFNLTCEAYGEWEMSNDPEYAEQQLNKHLKEFGIECPNCKFRYQLAKGGCMHFRCIQCSYDFCGGCGRPFKLGTRCFKAKICEKLGLHAHHPRHCLFYLRDKEVTDLQRLLQNHNIEYRTELEGDQQVPRCLVMEQKETDSGMKDEKCNRFVEAAGLCKLHYKEYLGTLIFQNKVDPIHIFNEDELELVLRRENIRLPKKPKQESEYMDKLISLILEKLPLDGPFIEEPPPTGHSPQPTTSSSSSPPLSSSPSRHH